MRWLLLLFLTAASISTFIIFKIGKNKPVRTIKNTSGILYATADIHLATMARLRKYTVNLKAYTLKKNFNTHYCFLIDMKMPSGSNRFFIYDLKNDSIVQAALVTHGSGINNLSDKYDFSNLPGSNCTSLGKYKIGKSYYGKFGLAYKLFGLDKSNSNAFNRYVVLHAHPCVPDYETAPLHICRSLGCPTVSPLFLNQLKQYLDNSTTPILLWIFN